MYPTNRYSPSFGNFSNSLFNRSFRATGFSPLNLKPTLEKRYPSTLERERLDELFPFTNTRAKQRLDELFPFTNTKERERLEELRFRTDKSVDQLFPKSGRGREDSGSSSSSQPDAAPVPPPSIESQIASATQKLEECESDIAQAKAEYQAKLETKP